MTFTIAIPVHNGEKFLAQTLQSAIQQTRPADEILVVDDASSDRSAEIIREWQTRHALRYVFNERPTGFVDAWNRAIQFATSDYITVLHQDDLLDERYVEITEKAFQQFPTAHHLYTGCYYLNERGEKIRTSPLPHASQPILLRGAVYAKKYLSGVANNAHIHRCPGVTTKRSLLVHECSYRKEAGLIADDDFFIRVGGYTDVIQISSLLASFREHGGSATTRLPSLTHQLAHDYLFAMQFHHQHREYLDDEGRKILARLGARFISLLLFEGLTTNNNEWIKQSCFLADDMEKVVSQWRATLLPIWSKTMWALVNARYLGIHSAALYARLVRRIVSTKNKVVGK